jgi:hypothetical protein
MTIVLVITLPRQVLMKACTTKRFFDLLILRTQFDDDGGGGDHD